MKRGSRMLSRFGSSRNARRDLAAACSAAPLFAHHSPAAFDATKEIRLEGTVTRFAYNNPHTYLTIDVTGADGRVTSQVIEAGPISTMQPLGMTRDSLQVGDRVTVRAVPRRAGAGTVLGLDATKADGTVVPLFLAAASVRPTGAALASQKIFGRLPPTPKWRNV